MASPEFAESETVKSESVKTDEEPIESNYLRPALVGATAALIAFVILISTNLREVTDNWEKYRCKPQYMLLAGAFGKNTNENFTYCANKVFKEEAAGSLGPIYKSMTQMVGFLSTILQTTNSLRVGMGTLVGGVSNVFQDFSSRFNQFFYAIRQSAQRIRSLMFRVYGTLFAVIYMGMSGVQAAQNFGNTTIGRFLDTFCFPPETPIFVVGRGIQPISSVKVGDKLLGGRRCTATFRFWADGQDMVRLGGVQVSTNHYVRYVPEGHQGEATWIMAGDHPDAEPAGQWLGGIDRPLVCLNTDDHQIQIGGHIFSDYDETEAGDAETQAWAERTLNGDLTVPPPCGQKTTLEYGAVLSNSVGVRVADGSYVAAADISLGTQLSNGGRVIGVIKKEAKEITDAGISPSTLVYHGGRWIRAGHLYQTTVNTDPKSYTALIVYPHSYIETDSGLAVRDYIEVFSPDAEQAYTRALTVS